MERGESVEEAIVREVREETGLQVEVKRLVGLYSDPESQVFTYPNGASAQFVTAFVAKRWEERLSEQGTRRWM